MNILNYRVNVDIIKTYGITRLHHAKYRNKFMRSYSLGVNIIPRKFGLCVCLEIVNRTKEAECTSEYWFNQCENLRDFIKAVCGGW